MSLVFFKQSLESQLAQEKIEVDHLQELLAAAKEKAASDKEALKKATRSVTLRRNLFMGR